MMKRSLFLFAAGLIGLSTLSGCSVQDNLNHVTASQIARPAFMVDRTVDSKPFALYAWERVRDHHDTVRLYIEGEDETNPVGLHLASRDRKRNVMYLAQPCQFGTDTDNLCRDGFYQPGTANVIASFDSAMNEMSRYYDIKGFELIGYGSGGNIASLLAASRDDVLSLRTVAGKLTPDTGLSAAAIAPQLANMPQHHFIGAADGEVMPETYHFFRQAMGKSECTHYTMVQDADHLHGWVNNWVNYLDSPIDCAYSMPSYDPAPFPPTPYDKGMGYNK